MHTSAHYVQEGLPIGREIHVVLRQLWYDNFEGVAILDHSIVIGRLCTRCSPIDVVQCLSCLKNGVWVQRGLIHKAIVDLVSPDFQ